MYFLKEKSKLFEVFKKWRAIVERVDCKIRCLMSEIGDQCSVEVQCLCVETDICWLEGSPDTAHKIIVV